MRILSESSPLIDSPVERDHKPAKAQYGKYRLCLGWEFGFYCTFCWLHESDFDSIGSDASGDIWIEHHKLQSQKPDASHVYSNCYYSCRWCNQHRSSTPNKAKSGARLLDPCRDAWAEHFDLVDSRLVPRSADAAYTESAYNVNSARKVAVRRLRAKAVSLAKKTLRKSTSDMVRLRQKLRAEPPSEQNRILNELHHARNYRRLSVLELQRFRAVPAYAQGARCRCGRVPELPEFAVKASMEIDVDRN